MRKPWETKVTYYLVVDMNGDATLHKRRPAYNRIGANRVSIPVTVTFPAVPDCRLPALSVTIPAPLGLSAQVGTPEIDGPEGGEEP